MLKTVYKLVSSRQFETVTEEIDITKKVIVRPTYLSICHADQRYYTGSRQKSVLDKKLPLALIHEATGIVIQDETKTFKTGQRVVMIPDEPTEIGSEIAENYAETSKFRSSSIDGFSQEYIALRPDRLVAVPEEVLSELAAYIEMISVGMEAIRRTKNEFITRVDSIGIWGDGVLAFIVTTLLHHYYPNTKLYLFGKHSEKVERFPFVTEHYLIDEIPKGLRISHAFECVGGQGSQSAINQIIDMINPQGLVGLMGVSEYPINVNTRMILEKGLTFQGSSRSNREDFVATVNLLKQNVEVRKRLETLLGQMVEVRSVDQMVDAFEKDLTNEWGKTIIKWEI